MKNKLFISLLSLALFVLGSCGEPAPIKEKLKPVKSHNLDSTSRYYDQYYEVYYLEGCEYIVVNTGSSRWGSHKGNCKNPIHAINQAK
jgi:hypothetical protein